MNGKLIKPTLQILKRTINVTNASEFFEHLLCKIETGRDGNIPYRVIEIGKDAFLDCALLRNVAISSGFNSTHEMLEEITSIRNIDCSLDNLKGKFDKLHIHGMCYYYPHKSMRITTL